MNFVGMMGSTLLIAACACSNVAQATESYIAQGPGYGLLIQITSKTDNQASGHITIVELNETGNVIGRNRPITAIMDGKYINITIQYPPGNDPSSVTITGSIVDSGMNATLFSANGPMPVSFKKAPATDFDKVIKEVNLTADRLRKNQ